MYVYMQVILYCYVLFLKFVFSEKFYYYYSIEREMKRNHLLFLFSNKFKEALIQFRICLNEKLKKKQIKKKPVDRIYQKIIIFQQHNKGLSVTIRNLFFESMQTYKSAPRALD